MIYVTQNARCKINKIMVLYRIKGMQFTITHCHIKDKGFHTENIAHCCVYIVQAPLFNPHHLAR
jgi:hypothetical protein